MTTFISEICCSCGIEFGIPSEYHGHLKRNKQTFNCPNGHKMSYHTNDEDRLRKRFNQEVEERRIADQKNIFLEREIKELKKKPKKKVVKKVTKKAVKKKTT